MPRVERLGRSDLQNEEDKYVNAVLKLVGKGECFEQYIKNILNDLILSLKKG